MTTPDTPDIHAAPSSATEPRTVQGPVVAEVGGDPGGVDGRLVDFNCVDVFGFGAGSDRVASMHMVYDTHPLREQASDKYAPSAAAPA